MTIPVFSELWALGLAFYLFSFWWVWVPLLLAAVYFSVKKRKRIALLSVCMFVLATLVVPAVITQVRYNEIYSPAAQERSVAYLLVTSNRAARELQSGDLVDLVSSIAEWARNGAHDATGADLCIKQRISANADEYMIEAIYNGDEETSVMASITQLAQVGCEPETP